MSNQQDSSSKSWIIVITSIIGVIGTITVAYFAFRGAIFPRQLEIEAAQTAQSIQSTQSANNILITQTSQSVEATKFAESIKATQTSYALNPNLTSIPPLDQSSQIAQATQIEATNQAIIKRQNEIQATQTATWFLSSYDGQWNFDGKPGPIIRVNGNLLTVDMSIFNRPNATGKFLNETTIEVNFPDSGIFIGRLVKQNQIIWDNGSIWER